jgi:hypothetical protein
MVETNLQWEITADEKRARNQKLLKFIVLPLLIIVVFSQTIAYPLDFFNSLLRGEFKEIIYDIIIFIAVFLITIVLYFAVNKVFPYAYRSYELTADGITIVKNKKKRTYTWHEFNVFIPYSMYRGGKLSNTSLVNGVDLAIDQTRNNLSSLEENTVGKIFYLRKKSRFIKKFVVLYSEPDNYNKVYDFLKNHIKEEEMNYSSDLGLVLYEFK